MKKLANEYPVPVETSLGTAGTAISKGWRIIIRNGNAFFVKENDKSFNQERYPSGD